MINKKMDIKVRRVSRKIHELSDSTENNSVCQVISIIHMAASILEGFLQENTGMGDGR